MLLVSSLVSIEQELDCRDVDMQLFSTREVEASLHVFEIWVMEIGKCYVKCI